MTLEEIKAAVDAGKKVHWSNPGYTVVKDKNWKYLIQFHSGDCIGLTWADGVTLNGDEGDFYIAEDAPVQIIGN